MTTLTANIYDTIEDSLATKLRKTAVDIKGFNKGLVDNTLKIGASLKTVHMLLQDHVEGPVEPKFLEWVTLEFPFGRSTAFNYMNVADKFALHKGFTDLSFDQSALFLIGAPKCPEGAVKQLMDEAERGKHITYQHTQLVISQYKPPKVEPQLQPLPAGQFNVFYATPFAIGLKPSDRKNAESMVLPANRHATLYLWVSPEHLTDGLRLMSEWAFTYKTSLALNDGYDETAPVVHHIQSQHWLCLVGTKGRGAPAATEGELGGSVASFQPDDIWEGMPGIVNELHPTSKVLQMYSVIPSPAAEGWALWNHRNLQVTSESATVPDEDDEPPELEEQEEAE